MFTALSTLQPGYGSGFGLTEHCTDTEKSGLDDLKDLALGQLDLFSQTNDDSANPDKRD